jgi:hypothetical protein
MTISLCHLGAENSFLLRCDVVSLGGLYLLLHFFITVTFLWHSQPIYEFLVPDDEGATILRNVRTYTPDDTAWNFRKIESSAKTTVKTSNLASSECRRHSTVIVSTNFGSVYGDTAELIICCFNWSVVSTACNDCTEVTSVIFIPYKYTHN